MSKEKKWRRGRRVVGRKVQRRRGRLPQEAIQTRENTDYNANNKMRSNHLRTLAARATASARLIAEVETRKTIRYEQKTCESNTIRR